MSVTSREINEKQFHDAWRGYNQEEVDDFLDKVAETLDQLERENTALQERLRELDQMVEASRSTEEMLKKTLVTAQKAAEEAIATAKQKAERLVSEAEERAQRAREELKERVANAEEEVRMRAARAEEEARTRAAHIEREQEARQQEMQASVDRLQGFETEIKGRLRAFLEQQVKALEVLEQLDKAESQEGDTAGRGGEKQEGPHRERSVTEPATVSAVLAGDEGDGEGSGTEGGGEAHFEVIEEPDFEDFEGEHNHDNAGERRHRRGLFRRAAPVEDEWSREG
ncbi:MAG: DivIVA domain-containing protein [Actinomycetota bacterium]